MNSLPKTVTRQRHDCELNPGPSTPESSTLTTRLPSHPLSGTSSTAYYILLLQHFLSNSAGSHKKRPLQNNHSISKIEASCLTYMMCMTASSKVAGWWQMLIDSQHAALAAISRYLPPATELQQTSCTLMRLSTDETGEMDRRTLDCFKMLTSQYADHTKAG